MNTTTMTRDLATPVLESVAAGLENLEDQLDAEIREKIQQLNQVMMGIGKTLQKAKQSLKRKGYQLYLSRNNITKATARKATRLVKTFAGFNEHEVCQVDPDLLQKLCTPRYKSALQKLRHEGRISSGLAQQVIEECKPESKLRVKDPFDYWQSATDGTRTYVVPLCEETGTEIEHLAKEKQVLPSRVIGEAIALYKQFSVLEEQPDIPIDLPQSDCQPEHQ